MKKLSFVSIFSLLIIFSGFTQDVEIETSKIKELGINFSNLYNFGGRYKVGKNNTALRITALSLNGNTINYKQIAPSNPPEKSYSLGAGFAIGFEKRKAITDKFGYYKGLDVFTSFNTTKRIYDHQLYTRQENQSSVNTGLAFILGVNYAISDKLMFSAEINPNICYLTSKNKTEYKDTDDIFTGTYKSKNNGLVYNLFNNSANITIAYRLAN